MEDAKVLVGAAAGDQPFRVTPRCIEWLPVSNKLKQAAAFIEPFALKLDEKESGSPEVIVRLLRRCHGMLLSN
jgi:hypothetical protein